MPTIWGIDPGISGAIVVIDGKTGRVTFYSFMPVMHSARGEVYIPALRVMAQTHGPILIAGLEEVNSGAVKGRQAAFTFGGAFYATKTFLEMRRIPFRLIQPKAWQAHFGLSNRKGKDKSVVLASQRYPEVDWGRIAKSKAHNLADACLLAAYAMETYSGDTSVLQRRHLK